MSFNEEMARKSMPDCNHRWITVCERDLPAYKQCDRCGQKRERSRVQEDLLREALCVVMLTGSQIPGFIQALKKISAKQPVQDIIRIHLHLVEGVTREELLSAALSPADLIRLLRAKECHDVISEDPKHA